MRYYNMDMEFFQYSKRLDIERYSVRITSSPHIHMAIEEAERTRVPEGFRRRLLRLESRDATADEIKALGKDLGQMLFPGTLQHAVRDNLGKIDRDAKLRIRLDLGRCFALADLPWEFAFLDDLEPTGFLALDGRISLARYEQIADTRDAFETNVFGSLRMAALLADPKDSPEYSGRSLHLEDEEEKIKSALSRVTGLQTDFRPRATVGDLNKALSSETHIFHFAGHGTFEKTMGAKRRSLEGKGFLVLLKEQKELTKKDKLEAEPYPVDRLVMSLQGCGVRLAVLGACESARQAGENAWNAIVPALAKIPIPAAIGMQYGIRNANATAFSDAFYYALALGEPIDWALAKGRQAVYQGCEPSDRDWGVPVLYLRMRSAETDTVLFPRLPPAQGTTPQPGGDASVTSSITPTHTCPGCGAEVQAGFKFCAACGQKLPLCSRCNGFLPPAARFCPACGAAMAPA